MNKENPDRQAQEIDTQSMGSYNIPGTYKRSGYRGEYACQRSCGVGYQTNGWGITEAK